MFLFPFLTDRCPSQTCTAVSVRTPSLTASPPATTSPPQTSPCARSASSPPAGRSSWSWWRMEWSAPCVWRPWPPATSRSSVPACWGPATRRRRRRWRRGADQWLDRREEAPECQNYKSIALETVWHFTLNQINFVTTSYSNFRVIYIINSSLNESRTRAFSLLRDESY